MKRLTVADVMTTAPVTARQDTFLSEIARLMYDKRVGGVPIVDEAGVVVGIVTERDLLKEKDVEPNRMLWYAHPRVAVEAWRRRENLRARDVMTRSVVGTPETASLEEAARAMITHGVNRLPIVRKDGTLAGIVGRQDLLGQLIRGDTEIMLRIRELLAEAGPVEFAGVHLRVEDGVVEVAGEVERRSDARMLVEAINGLPGVCSVVDEIGWARPNGPRPRSPRRMEAAQSRLQDSVLRNR